MTIKQVSNQLYKRAVGGYFNHQKFTKKELSNYLETFFRPEFGTTRWVMEIALPDGWWYMTINHYNDKRDGYDYTIPDNKDQETKIKSYIGMR